MKKFAALFSTVLIFTAGLSALSVDQDELNTTQNTIIEFINYVGPHKKIDSLEAIKKIGSDMGKVIGSAEDITKPSETGNKSKYYVIHAVDPSDKSSALDADILFLGNDAQVDHIRNLRYIIASYLSSAYGYSDKDAETIATFVTVYNAVYRNDLDYFGKKYKTVVTQNLTKDKCGLAVTYREWPGKSQIVIPLFDVKGGISTVDTSVISDTKVIDSMQEDDDKNIDPRKDMVDLKEREAENASDKAQEAQKKAADEKKKAADEKQKLTEEKKKTDEAQAKASETQKKAEEAKKDAEQNPDDKEKQQAAKEAEKEAAKAESDLNEQKQAEKAQEEKTQKAEKSAEEAKKNAEESQKIADKKTAEAQEERKVIAKDQKEVQDKEAAQAKMTTEYGLTLIDDAGLYSRIVKFNIEDGKSIKDSPVTTIRNRTAYKEGDAFIAVCGENILNGTVKLVLIDKDSLEITNESNETLSDLSVLVKDGSDYYCVIISEGKFYAAKYGADLKLKVRSTIQVKPATPITITDSGVVVTNSKGKFTVLSKDKLEPIGGSVDDSDLSFPFVNDK
ncbi:MAG: hypothetical protein HUK25_04275 [Treponema sp.]|nr:hypothetical protein [Treponema sp.]